MKTPTRKCWRITVGYVGEEVYLVQARTARAAIAQARKKFRAAKRGESVEVEKVLAREA